MDVVTNISAGAASRAAQSISEAFPEVNPLVTPCGSMVLVQLRSPKLTTAGGLLLVAESQDYDKSMVRVGRVISMGPIAFKNRDSMKEWPEGAWAKIGDFVRVPTMAGIDSWRVLVGSHKEKRRGTGDEVEVKDWVNFVLFNDFDIKGLIKGDPLEVIDYV